MSTVTVWSLTSVPVTGSRSVYRHPLTTLETVLVCILFLLLQASDDFVEGRTAEIVGRYCNELFGLFNARPNSFVSVVNTNWGLKMLDKRPERIYGPTLLALSLVLVIFTTS
jgi:hypothetical protein